MAKTAKSRKLRFFDTALTCGYGSIPRFGLRRGGHPHPVHAYRGHGRSARFPVLVLHEVHGHKCPRGPRTPPLALDVRH